MLSELAVERTGIDELEVQNLEPERSPCHSLSALRTESALARERLDSFKCPVSTLPSELVSEIFIHFLPTYPSYPPLKGLLSPTILTQICGMWRQIALSTPDLWRAISYSGKNTPELAQVHLWLSRSKHCPLLIKVNSWPDDEALAALFAHRIRWEQANFEILPSHLSTIHGPIPLLRELRVSTTGDESSVFSLFKFCEMPVLRTVVLNFFAAANIVLPWAQLTSLTLTLIYPEEWVPILQQTVNLVHCSMELSFGGSRDPPADIRLMCLESLTLEVQEPMHGCLETLILPALCRLEVPESFLDPNPIETLGSFISKSGCTKLHEVRITEARQVAMDSYWQAFPSIANFFFEYEDEEEDSASEEISDSE
ncbi:hypothetical protein DFH06DRAFT_1327079 [Mycena polygramma]|nr:hypothetical protein DFH06DRAFT_1327079 [Mycena polygramma]